MYALTMLGNAQGVVNYWIQQSFQTEQEEIIS